MILTELRGARRTHEAITDCEHRKYCYRYLVRVALRDQVADAAEVAAILQSHFFYDGAVTAGFFHVVGPGSGYQNRLDNAWYAVIERPDCESDYHNCYVDTGHDGSDDQAVHQLQQELLQAVENMPTENLLARYSVSQRAAIPADELSPWEPASLLVGARTGLPVLPDGQDVPLEALTRALRDVLDFLEDGIADGLEEALKGVEHLEERLNSI